MTVYIILSFVSFLAGYIASIAGSSGLIMLPALLMANIPPHIALGTNKLYTTSSLFVSSITFFRKGLFNPRYWIASILASIAGSIIGVIIINLVSSSAFSKILPFFIAFIAVYTCLPKKRYEAIEFKKVKTIKQTIPAFILGIYSGFLGAGTGAIWTNVAMRLFKLDIKNASAISRFFCLISNLSALLVFIFCGDVNYFLGVTLALSGSIGAYLGARMMLKIPPAFIKYSIASLTFILSVELGYKAYFSA